MHLFKRFKPISPLAEISTKAHCSVLSNFISLFTYLLIHFKTFLLHLHHPTAPSSCCHESFREARRSWRSCSLCICLRCGTRHQRSKLPTTRAKLQTLAAFCFLDLNPSLQRKRDSSKKQAEKRSSKSNQEIGNTTIKENRT